MTKAKATTQMSSPDRRPAEFQAALDAYLLGYRRYHQNRRRLATPTKAAISRLVRSARSWALASGIGGSIWRTLSQG